MHFAKFFKFPKSIVGYQIGFKSDADFFAKERTKDYEADKSFRAEGRY